MSTPLPRIRPGPPAPAALFRVWESAGWNGLYRCFESEIAAGFDRSWRCCSAWDGEEPVAIGRAMSDGILYGVLFDVIVVPEHRGRGFGTAVVEWLLAECREAGLRDVLLFSARGTVDFYRRFGFVPRPDEAPGMIVRMVER